MLAIFLAKGSAISAVGKLISKPIAIDCIHTRRKFDVRPRLMSVLVRDIVSVIPKDIRKVINIDEAREFLFCIGIED